MHTLKAKHFSQSTALTASYKSKVELSYYHSFESNSNVYCELSNCFHIIEFSLSYLENQFILTVFA